MLERHAAGEVRGHHDHPGDPEEDDVVAGDQHAAGQVEVVVVGGCVALLGPAHGAEGHQGRRVPGVEHVVVAPQRFARRLGLGFGFVARHIDLAVFVVPGRNLVAPPELAGDAPVLDVVHPLVVGVDPVLGHELHLARLHRRNRLVGDGGAAGVFLVALGLHGDKPLVGEHGLDDLAGAGAARHHELVLFGLDQQAGGFQVGDHGLAGHKAVHAVVLLGCVVVDRGVQRQHADHGQLVALAHGVVVGVVGGRDLDHAGAKGLVHVVVGDDRDFAVAQRQLHVLADQRGVALVFGVHHHGHVAQHGFGAGGGHGQRAGAVGQRVGDVPHEAVFFFALDFQVAHRAHQDRVPVDQALAAVDQALLIQLHKGLGHDLGQLVVHGEVLAAPVHRVAHAAHLVGDGVAALFFPFPDLGDKVLARLGGVGPRSWRLMPWACNWRSTTIWVAMPAWSVPGIQAVLTPRMRW